HNWTIQNNQIIFAKDDSENTDIPSSKMIWNTLGYARELERIAYGLGAKIEEHKSLGSASKTMGIIRVILTSDATMF
ncbi:hypothetical protein HK405_012461, partial [Cladochytrium tenue]